ncbi:MAG TPA: hypothetical protein VF221_03805 [Chloroflexota bacterium]
MGRTMVSRAEKPARRRWLDAAFVAAAAIVVLFAAVGVVSAGTFVADKLSTKSANPPRHHTNAPTTSALAQQDLRRAQAQATAIVKQAQSAGHSIVASANTKARRQAGAVLASAHRQAAALAQAQPAPTVAPAPAAGTNVGSNGVTAGQTSAGTNTGGTGVTTGANNVSTGVAAASTSTTSGVSTAPFGAGVPNLSGLPSTWLVVGYNATFGNGPGSAGGISVINRSGKTFSGVATVKYARGGTSSASFAGLAPGQTLVLPLNGARYPGGGYRIIMSGVH